MVILFQKRSGVESSSTEQRKKGEKMFKFDIFGRHWEKVGNPLLNTREWLTWVQIEWNRKTKKIRADTFGFITKQFFFTEYFSMKVENKEDVLSVITSLPGVQLEEVDLIIKPEQRELKRKNAIEIIKEALESLFFRH